MRLFLVWCLKKVKFYAVQVKKHSVMQKMSPVKCDLLVVYADNLLKHNWSSCGVVLLLPFRNCSYHKECSSRWKLSAFTSTKAYEARLEKRFVTAYDKYLYALVYQWTVYSSSQVWNKLQRRHIKGLFSNRCHRCGSLKLILYHTCTVIGFHLPAWRSEMNWILKQCDDNDQP